MSRGSGSSPHGAAAARRARIAALLAGVLAVVGASAAWELARVPRHDAAGASASVRRFHSRPDLRPDALAVDVRAPRGTARGYVFVAVKRGPGQDGPMIVDDRGRVVWFRPAPAGMAATMFRVQRYRGRRVLTWWQGHTAFGHGAGEYVILDDRYRVLARVRAGHGYMGDHHAFTLTRHGTALMSVYAPRAIDLSAVGGPRHGTIFESIVQELDVASGRVVWEWHSADHVPVTEGMTPPRSGRPHDYFHINAIDVDRDGNLLISARNTHAIYKVDRRSGRILWRLGGRRSDFRLGPGAHFAFQHDAQRRADGTISLFDNEATPAVAAQSRGLVLRLHPRRHSATLVRAYTHPDHLLPGAEGNVQTLPNGDVFMGWGPAEHVSELSRGGRLLFDLTVPPGADTYQAFRFRWRGRPLERPAIAARRGAGGRVTVWASWNGATDVRRWQLLAGPNTDALAPVASAPRRDFETAITTRTGASYLAVRALDRAGRTLGSSRALRYDGASYDTQ